MRRLKRILTWLALVVMVTVIAGYWFVTDPTRVRGWVEQIASRELGAKVTVGDARLSIFEGLRLDDVRITADAPDAKPIFEAKRLHVSYDPSALFGGKVAAERVVLVEPRVKLIEDLDNKRWNFQLLDHRGAGGPASRSSTSRGMLALPEILVRNARFDYAQIENGRESEVGTLHLEGAYTPDADGTYRFRVQGRGGAERTFPVAEGVIRSDRSAVHMVVNDVEFVDEIRSILPAQVRRFWDQHKLAGRLDELRFDLFRKPDGHAGYSVTTDWADVSLVVPPTTWMGPSDKARVQAWQEAYGRLGSRVLGDSVVARSIVDSMTPAAMKLDDVSARFVFTDEQVRIERLLAHVDGNALQFSGHIDGYSAEAGVDLKVESPPNTPLVLPQSPGFVPAMPWPVQEIYYRFRPVGVADVWLRVQRPSGAEQPQLSGELNVRDATFVFDRLPYPVERASGKFRFGNDTTTGREMLEIVDVTGHGPINGPNAGATLNVHGTISPLDDAAGADIHITGKNVAAEPRLIASLPPLTQHAVRNFDANNTGTLPSFSGAFGCDVYRAVGLGQPWTISTRLDLSNAAGLFKNFPYPVKDASGSVKIFDDHVEITSIKMPAGGGTAELAGTISWAKHDAAGEPLIQPELVVKTRNVAFDDALLNALPASKRGAIARLGLSGRLDVDGRIEPSAPDSEEPAVDLAIRLSNGASRPPGVAVAVEQLQARVRVKGERVDVDSFDGTVAGAAISGTAYAEAGAGEPKIHVEHRVYGLDAQKAPIDALNPDAAKVIRSLHAKGKVDLDVTFNSETDYRVVVRPQELSVTPDLLPLKLDSTGGRVVVVPGSIRLEKLTARHGSAPVSLDGTIDSVTGDAEMALAGRDLVIDNKFAKALPAVLQDVVTTLALSGPVAIDCPKLVIKQPTTQPVAQQKTHFDAKLWLQKASMQVAADLKEVAGSIALVGDVDGTTLTRLDGQLSIDDMLFAGRRVSRLSATMGKRPEDDLLRLSDLSARVAGGSVAGRIDTMLDKRDPRFALDLRVRGAKVGELSGDDKLDGTLNGSLAMEGRWDNPRTRRGRGDILVQGKEMVRVPVVFGLLQVANLAVPNNKPIRQAAMRYTVEGQRIRMDQIDLRSTESVMAGDGMLDFDKKTLQLNLALAESAADSIPIFGDLIRSTRQDLLKLRIRGSLTGPTDGGQAFNIFNGTVDEVKDAK